MKILRSRNPTIALRIKMVFLGFGIVSLSFAALVFVIWFQRSTFGSSLWDIQGATGAATVLPSFAGVGLAVWAIYFQVKTSAPSYKAAEQSWLDVSELYHRALKIGALMATIDVDEPTNSDYEPSDTDLDQAPSSLDDFKEQVRTAKGIYVKRCAGEFCVEMKPDGKRTLATLFLHAAPILESLQAKLGRDNPIVLVQLEVDIDIVASTYDANADYNELAIWMNGAISVLRRLIDLIEALFDRGVLNVDAIEDALLNPLLAKTNREWFEQGDAIQEWRSSRRALYPNRKEAEARS